MVYELRIVNYELQIFNIETNRYHYMGTVKRKTLMRNFSFVIHNSTFVIRNSAFVIFFFIALSCAAQKNNTKSYYHEDLYSLRPKFPEVVDSATQNQDRKKADVIATHQVNEKVDGVLDSINRFNVTRKLIDGFTIQIYSGQNREEAMNAKKKMVTDVTGLTAELEYNQPKFRVKVGSYYSRLEAQKDILNLKRSFPNAILVPEKIVVR